jgi:hypothetical protein
MRTSCTFPGQTLQSTQHHFYFILLVKAELLRLKRRGHRSTSRGEARVRILGACFETVAAASLPSFTILSSPLFSNSPFSPFLLYLLNLCLSCNFLFGVSVPHSGTMSLLWPQNTRPWALQGWTCHEESGAEASGSLTWSGPLRFREWTSDVLHVKG